MDAPQEIKSRLDIADIVGEYLQLKTAGSGAFKALCPFHNEKTPSFYISRPRQSWHCFGCDQGGDIISFVMKIEGMEFREALEHLARKAGVELPTFEGQRSSQKKRIHEVNELAKKFFQSVLNTQPQADEARSYVKRRGVDDLTSDLFHLGYAPDNWDALTRALMSKGVRTDELLLAGLVVKGERGVGVYDRFRNRLMFPIADVHGNVVGFTGRILDNSKVKSQNSKNNVEAKYVNTPETSAYRKSAVLYGLDKAKAEIRRQDLAVIVEGNMDVVGSHQFNVTNVVAASGTAFTSEQLSLIKRFTTNLAIAFDQDKAGAAATLRGLDLARAQDFNIKIISLPPEAGKDPDEAVRKDPRLWTEAIARAVNIIEWIYRNAFESQHQNLTSAEEKKGIAKMILPEIARIADAVERDHWIKKLASDLAVSEGAIREAMNVNRRQVGLSPGRQEPSGKNKPIELPTTDYRLPTVASSASELERRVMACAIFKKELFALAFGENRLDEGDLTDEKLRALYTTLKKVHNFDEIPRSLDPDEMALYDAAAFLAEREFQEMTLADIERELNAGIGFLRKKRKSRELENLKQEMAHAELAHDERRIEELSRKFQSLT